ncbi:hypothetical protein DM02DRAFT_734328 [Periconia macrospinosa]|uniref:Uncharacterized protein n=1 Tax=Periconia macrospinosa TaxID=97972 RepID=A0A2V1D0L7_9PLEO|nr:hypothetical protein DM02DRAFT_734328 [Periconia macrospinosa]
MRTRSTQLPSQTPPPVRPLAPTQISNTPSQISSQLSSQLSPVPSSSVPNTSFEIHEDDDEVLTVLESEQVPCPTEFQVTNEESEVVHPEARLPYQAPYDYSFIKWTSTRLDGLR